jgi:hypothetical protein
MLGWMDTELFKDSQNVITMKKHWKDLKSMKEEDVSYLFCFLIERLGFIATNLYVLGRIVSVTFFTRYHRWELALNLSIFY